MVVGVGRLGLYPARLVAPSCLQSAIQSVSQPLLLFLSSGDMLNSLKVLYLYTAELSRESGMECGGLDLQQYII